MVTIKKVSLSEVDTLLAFSRSTFYEFFAHLNDPANMEAYAVTAFSQQRILSELSNPNSQFYFALLDDELVGYIKLNFGDAQTEFKHNNALEVERIYVSGGHHGKKIGKQLLTFAIDTAVKNKFDYIWLGVWDQNAKAISFYEYHGFKLIGSHDFYLGDEQQVDLLMKKEFSAAEPKQDIQLT